MSSKGVTITLEPEDGCFVPIELSSRMRRRCRALSTIPQGAILRRVQVEPLRVVMSYLDGDDSLSIFTDHNESNTFLLLFAQTWVLAARLGLPVLQNDLMTIMISIHACIIDGRVMGPEYQYTTDKSMLKAFQHLRDQVERDSHAERFLIRFAGRTAPLVDELEQNLNSGRIECDIRNGVLAEARSFGPDSIKYQPEAFLINPEKPPRYRPLEIQPNKIRLVRGSRTSAGTTPSIIVSKEDISQMSTTGGASGSEWRKDPAKPSIPRILDIDDSCSLSSPSSSLSQPSLLSLSLLSSRSSQPSQPSQPCSGRAKDLEPRAPYIIQIVQNNNNENRTHNGDNNTAVAQAQGGGRRRNGTVRAVAHSGGHSYKLIRERKGKRCKWFSLFTCGSKHY